MEEGVSVPSAGSLADSFSALSADGLTNSFVGNTAQVCVVTRDFMKTIRGFVDLGIGPWALYTFGPDTVSDQTYMGRPASYSMRLALATAGNMLWEVIQPLEGPSIYQDFLAAHGEGVHHVAFGCESLPYAERIKAFESRGCKMIQSGVLGNVPFAYFETEGLISTTVEIYDLPEGFTFPEPDQWVPGPPSR